MKKDFFGGREEVGTIYSLCGEPRCRDQQTCQACRSQEDEYGVAAATPEGGVAAGAEVLGLQSSCSGSCDDETVIETLTIAEEGGAEAAAADEGSAAAARPPVAAARPPVAAAEPLAEAAGPPRAAGWGYQPWNGPDTWHHQYPVAKGRRQSPIDLQEADLKFHLDGQLPQLVTCFQPATGLPLENTGASWLLNWPQDDPDAACMLRGGPLAGEYRLLQMHAHWGAERGRGSEHTLEGRSLEGELHLVFYNTFYSSPGEAMDQPDGLAVIGILLSESEQAANHPEFDKITRLLGGVLTRGRAVTIEEELNPGSLLPEGSQAYFTYPGSLTTPPLYESVTWLVMKKPMELPTGQMDMMRAMRSGPEDDSAPLVDNFRPPCCAAGRRVRARTA